MNQGVGGAAGHRTSSRPASTKLNWGCELRRLSNEGGDLADGVLYQQQSHQYYYYHH